MKAPNTPTAIIVAGTLVALPIAFVGRWQVPAAAVRALGTPIASIDGVAELRRARSSRPR